MNLIGQVIQHKLFGDGVVTDWSQSMVAVSFPQGEKKFLYPDSFEQHLTVKNAAVQTEIQRLLKRRAAERSREKQAFQARQDRKNFLEKLKITPNSQAVFDIRPERRQAVFASWSVSTGQTLSGGAKGEPRVPVRLKPNSLCLLTERPTDAPEARRRIIGAFMADAFFLGSGCRDGIVPSHPLYRLRLETPAPFWPCLPDAAPPRSWGDAPFKYLSNTAVEEILFGWLGGAGGGTPRFLRQAEALYRYYCQANRLPCRADKQAADADREAPAGAGSESPGIV